MDFVGIDTDNWTFQSWSIRVSVNQKMMIQTVFLMHGMHPLEVLAPKEDLIVDLVPVCHCYEVSDTILHCV